MKKVNVLNGIIKLCIIYRKDYQSLISELDTDLKKRMENGTHTEEDIAFLSELFHLPKKTLRFISDYDICTDEKALRAVIMKNTSLYRSPRQEEYEKARRQRWIESKLEKEKQEELKLKEIENLKIELQKRQQEYEKELNRLKKENKKLKKLSLDFSKQEHIKDMWKKFVDGDISEDDIRFQNIKLDDYIFLKSFTPTEIIKCTERGRTFYWRTELQKDNYMKFSTFYITTDYEIGKIEFTFSNYSSELYDYKQDMFKKIKERTANTLLNTILASIEK